MSTGSSKNRLTLLLRAKSDSSTCKTLKRWYLDTKIRDAGFCVENGPTSWLVFSKQSCVNKVFGVDVEELLTLLDQPMNNKHNSFKIPKLEPQNLKRKTGRPAGRSREVRQFQVFPYTTGCIERSNTDYGLQRL